MPKSPAWKAIDKLIDEQKLEEASRAVAALRKDARAAGNDGEVTRAILREVQLREALSGTETAVRFLRDEPWPAEPVSRLALQLYYAQALMSYLQMYSWEIGQREKVESKGPIDLKAWTRDQIIAEAERSYQEVWGRRAELSSAPLGQLGEYLTPNDYPAGIRDTLRDAVTYFAVALLADSSSWTAEESNELYRVDLPAMLSAAAQPAVKLDERTVHPLARAVAALDDLEHFHQAAGHAEAALEARLARLRRLHQHFTGVADRAAIAADLAARLPPLRQLPWYSMGMAQLADFTREAGDLVAARRLAEQGAEAHPTAPGGKRCLALLRELEAPDYALAAMRADGPGKRSLQVTHRNLPALYLRAYRVDLLARVTAATDYDLLPGQNDLKALLRGPAPAAQWKVELPATPDLRSHTTYVTPPLSAHGLYAIVASTRADFGEAKNRIVGVNFLLTNLVVLTRHQPDGGEQVTTVAGDSGKTVGGVELLLYRYDWQKRHNITERRASDAVGQYAFSAAGHDGAYFLIAHQGQELAMAGDNLYFNSWRDSPTVSSTLIYTDRSIYRPEQTLYYKAVAYGGNARTGELKVQPGAALTISLRDPNGETVAEQQVKTNSFGTAAGTFSLPTGRLLGGWSVVSSAGGQASVRVEEYKRPTFEVSLKDPVGELRLNQPATLGGEARYYFGLPLTSGKVRYRVTRAPVFPWWWGFYHGYGRGFGGPEAQAQPVAAGVSEVGKDGSFRVTFTPAADERQAAQPGLSYRYQVHVDLTDEGGETRSADKGLRVGYVAVEAELGTDGGFLLAGARAEVSAHRSDLAGKGRAGKASWQLFALTQPPATVMSAELPAQPDDPGDGDGPGGSGDGKGGLRTAGDRLRPRWIAGDEAMRVIHGWKDGAVLQQGELVHDDKGEARIALAGLSAGAYRVRYQTTDAFGAVYKTFHDFVVANPRGATPLALPAMLAAEQRSVAVGGTARFLVTSGLADALLFFEIYKDGRLQERRRLDGHDGLVQVPVRAEDRGGFGVVLWMVRDHQLVQSSAAVMVPWDDKELQLSFSTFRDTLRPGQKETFRITVKGPGDKVEAGTAELLAYMYDRSLDAFAPHHPPSIGGLYPQRTGITWERSSLGQQSAMWVSSERLVDIPSFPSFSEDQLAFIFGRGIGGPGHRSGGRLRGEVRMMMAPGSPPAMAAPAPMAAAALAKPDTGSARMAKRAAEPAADQAEAKADKPAPSGEPVRSNFAETAFFAPQLLSDGQGQVAVEFTVPDSVTSWTVWAHAITRDLRGGSLSKESRSVKELMVRPYLPRFFREGDQVDLKVVVNNASDHPLAGTLRFELFDPETQKDLAADFGVGRVELPFAVEKGGGGNLTFPVKVPPRVGPVALRATARSGDFSDGELRPLPVLPGRMHLAQSRFVTLKDKDARTMTFADLARGDDPTLINEQMVVTVDAQLFYTVLKALPYLTEYPYECTEQTLNRFVSTGIVSSVYKQYPAVARMAETLSKRTTRLETWDSADPNRKMALEETPWLRESRGGPDVGLPLLNVLDPRVAAAQQRESLAKLQKVQTSIGGFPWFPGGPPSPFMTLYLMYGFAKAAEFQVEVPKETVQRGWQYLAAHFRDQYLGRMRKKEAGVEFVTFLNYVASAYPDESWTGGALQKGERKEMLDYSFARWKDHSPYLKALLALTLSRMERKKDAQLVLASIMDSAKTAPDQGTFWAQEDRSWLWYNDTTETHAFVLRALSEIAPQDPRQDGLVLWLLLDKKLNHWKSTRATAEVIYSLVKQMQKQGSLGVREEIKVSAPPRSETFVFEPDQFVGKGRIVIPGSEIDARKSSTITVEKQTKGFAFASAVWHFSTEKLPADDRGDFFHVSRRYFKRDGSGKEVKLVPLADGARLVPGDEVEVQVSLRSKHAAEYVHLRDPRPAGFEPATTVSGYKWDLGIVWYEEVRDSGENFFFEWLPVGEYTFKYRLRATLGGVFKVAPATVQAMYAPEFVAYSAGNVVTISGN